ncbi:MAG: hypothetical protein J5441_01875 [Clostridia bacterium]|nr:hypothetical protein [Clostridia bacterium]
MDNRVRLYEDGKYRWVYEMSLFKNPTVFLLLIKIFSFIFLGMFVLMTLIGMGDSDFWWSGFLSNLKIFGIIFAGMIVLVGIGYLIYAAIMGGKYVVEFEMDDNGVNHRQTEKQAKKARGIGAAAAVIGAAAGRPGTVGAGLAATRTEMYSEFAKVRRVKAYPRRGLLKVNAGLNHNQVYAAPEDFEFVRGFIVSHCPNLK